MPATVLAMLIILVLAAIIIGVVVVGMEGTGRHRAPEVAQMLAHAGRHLNGEADPPRGLVEFFEEAEEGAGDLRALPDALRAKAASARSAVSARSARSAVSARSARSAASARSARSAASARSARSAASAPRQDELGPNIAQGNVWAAPGASVWANALPPVQSTEEADQPHSTPVPAERAASEPTVGQEPTAAQEPTVVPPEPGTPTSVWAPQSGASVWASLPDPSGPGSSKPAEG